MESADYLIIGGGHAGDRAAATLRKEGANGRVLLISAEEDYPYMRYTLSKEFILGKRPKPKVYLHPPRFYDNQAIDVRLGEKAATLDTKRRIATLDDGKEVEYQKLLIATGARLNKLALPGSDLAGVYYLRTLADAEAIQNEIAVGRRAVIVGGGFIGVEVAAALTQLGMKVTLVDTKETLWSHLFGESIGRHFHEALQNRSVTIISPAHVERIDGDSRARQIVTREGHTLACDFVVIGVGVAPEVALAETAGLKVDNGIVANEYLETTEEGVFAAGDNARFYSPLFRSQMRIEHWDVAGQQGVTAAMNMLGQVKPFDQAPYFFSRIFDIWLDFVGYAPTWDQLMVRRYNPESFISFYCGGSNVKGALLVNRSRELKSCRELIQRRKPLTNLALLEESGRELSDILS